MWYGWRLDLEWVGGWVEHDRRDVDRCDPVDERMVHPRDQAGAASRQSLDEVDLPERARAVQAVGHQVADQLLELLAAAGRGERHAAHVAVGVEVAVLHPDRVRDPERGLVEAHRVVRYQVDALAEAADHLVATDMPLEDQHPAHVHVDRAALGLDRRDVGRGKRFGRVQSS